MSQPTHGDVLAAVIDQEIDLERGRKASFEQRGAWVVLSSGTLATLLFALVASITKGDGFVLPAASRWSLGIALGFFAAAAGGAIFLNWPQTGSAGSLDADSLQQYMNVPWSAAGQGTAAEVAKARVDILRQMRDVNNRRAYGLLGALTAEAAAVLTLAVGVLAILL